MSMLATVAVNRFGLGARPGEIGTAASDPRAWLIAQLEPETTLPAPMAELPSTLEDLSAFARWTGQLATKARSQGMDPASMTPRVPLPAMGVSASEDATPVATPMLSVEADFRSTFGPRHAKAWKARFDVAVATERPFFERLVHFWSNHFVVSGAKPGSVAMPPSFERDVIRPHVMGRFVDMLLASTRHPAMLVYLDNVQSIGPNSALARDPSLRSSLAPRDFAIPASRGLNENLAREILELQTLGVRSGYSQADVTAFAKVLTGWTIARPPRVSYLAILSRSRVGGPGLFDFDSQAHEPGPQTVLGEVWSQPDAAQGEALLRRLAAHPSTAHFIATKLARHFIADEPPAAAVDRLARVFLDSDGDLRAVCAALVSSPEAFAPALPKFKTPQEYLVSAARALPGLRMDAVTLQRAVAMLGQVPYNPPGPNGWPDIEGEWLGADAVWKRLQWADATARRLGGAVQPVQLAQEVLGHSLSSATRQALERAESPVQGLTLLLASAEFQRR